MRLAEVRDVLGAEVLVGGTWLEREVNAACGADLMSDVLAFSRARTMLLTGLTNPQVIRTAEMIDMTAIVFVRGKRPSSEVIAMAEERGIPLLLTEYPLYEACGLLFSRGLGGNHCRQSQLSARDGEEGFRPFVESRP
ncbi:MAG: DRTGG domain-containing protein [Bacillota bacterium]